MEKFGCVGGWTSPDRIASTRDQPTRFGRKQRSRLIFLRRRSAGFLSIDMVVAAMFSSMLWTDFGW